MKLVTAVGVALTPQHSHWHRMKGQRPFRWQSAFSLCSEATPPCGTVTSAHSHAQLGVPAHCPRRFGSPARPQARCLQLKFSERVAGQTPRRRLFKSLRTCAMGIVFV